MSISVSARELEKLYAEAGDSNLVDFVVEGDKEPVKVLFQDIQYDVVKGNMTHVDFLQIQMGVEMETTIALEFVGEPAAVKALGGTLAKNIDTVSVRCLPKNLVGSIEVDLSTLETFEDAIHVKDLKLPEGIVATDNPTNMIAKVTPPLSEEQLKAMEESEAPTVEDVEVEGDKKDGAAPVEGGEEKKEEVKEEGDKKE
ncbi:50S ribosomal protein L25 [Candidatus Parcubacteria bacterium]|nr:MAG: 50S ribosomal protein L25 [Candidatus Parcubacteria bacterium]